MRKLWWLLAAAAAIPVAGVIYQKLTEQADRRRHSKAGRMVRAGASSLYVQDVRSGQQDAAFGATIVFESGIGATSQNWSSIQRALSGDAHTFSYDRAGLGWSTGPACPTTPRSLAGQLRALLAAAGAPPPYLLVAHSFGGLVARQFAAEWPGEVTGLVLVDPMRAEDWPPLNPAQAAFVTRGIRLARAGRIAARFGLTRLFMRSTLLGSARLARVLCRIGGEPAQNLMDRMLCEVGKMPREVWPSVVANWSRPEFFRTLESYLTSVPQAVEETLRLGPLGLPVVVLTPATATPLRGSQLRDLSSDARQVFADHSAHWVHLDEPELVLNAIREMLSRAATSQPA
jgi:pimeloyl-ACP methyl ester carboxylesterase